MYANLAEVVPEARLHERPRDWIEWLAPRANDFVHDRRNGFFVFDCRLPIADLPLQPFFPALLAFAVRSGRAAARAFALQPATAQHCHRRFRGRSHFCCHRSSHITTCGCVLRTVPESGSRRRMMIVCVMISQLASAVTAVQAGSNCTLVTFTLRPAWLPWNAVAFWFI